MLKLFLFLLVQMKSLDFKQIFITFNRMACSWDQSDCDGSQARPYSNPIIAFTLGVFQANLENSDILEFYFEAGGHIILPVDFSSQSSTGGDNKKSLFESYHGKIQNTTIKKSSAIFVIFFSLSF